MTEITGGWPEMVLQPAQRRRRASHVRGFDPGPKLLLNYQPTTSLEQGLRSTLEQQDARIRLK